MSVCLLSLVFSSQAEGRLNLEHCHYCSLCPPSLSLSASVITVAQDGLYSNSQPGILVLRGTFAVARV